MGKSKSGERQESFHKMGGPTSHLCSVGYSMSHTDDFTTLLHNGDISMAWLLFCTTALPDDGTMRLETCRSFVN
jgi:hypothetical protein